ncbi:MAG: ATP-binding protein, partial [Chthoniobacteraceae bacterium]
FRDFTSYKNAEKELERAKETAENANRLKDQFLAMLSHELRTPLTPVLATFSIWDMNDSVPAELKNDVQMLRHSIELEARLIDDLLDLTRIVKGILHLTLEVENVHHLIESVVTMYMSEMHGKHLSLTTHLDALKHHANIDPARVQQIFGNLLKNATKFTPENGTIVITTGNDAEGNLTVTFKDNGIGISKETLMRLFLPFEQGEHKLSHRYEGLGLGLAISKSLVDALGGTISATSDGPGTGASMTVTFPTVPPSQRSTLMSMQGADDQKRSLKILLLEDHGHTSQVMSRLLKIQGYDVHPAASVESGKELVKEQRFDLLLCDLGLPDGTGMDFLREVRKFDQTPAIALSGFGMEEDIARCMEAGFNAHLTKPIDIQRLEAIIRQVTSKS